MRFAIGAQPVQVNVRTQTELLRNLKDRLVSGKGFSVATLNLDHLVKLSWSTSFSKAYSAQTFVTADGRPIVSLSRLAGQPVELIPGSELIQPICRIAAQINVPIALLGSTQDALDRAAQKLQDDHPGLQVAASLPPSSAFDPDGPEADELIATLRRSGARLCFLALGAPKQERFAARASVELPNVGFLSIGAGLDFIAGQQKRAPLWMRKIALEWLWRTLENPARMAPRYARCFAILPKLTWMALRTRFESDPAI